MENKFINFEWKLLLQECSSDIASINQIKIEVTVIYYNLKNKSKDMFTMVLNENEFNDFAEEITKMTKYFK